MMFCQMGSAHSLREIHGGLATALGKLRHLGLDDTPARSSLSYANAHRPWGLYQTVFYQVLNRRQDVALTKGRKFRFKNPLRSLDASVIGLCLETFDWAKFRRTKGAVTLHWVLDHQGRRIVVWDDENEREIALLTNIMHLAASTVAAMRRQIERFFKALKQTLKVKTFVGTSENAVKTQTWTALIAILLLKFMQLKSTFNWSLSNLAALLRFNLLTYRDLWAWLDDPYNTPAVEPALKQLSFILN